MRFSSSCVDHYQKVRWFESQPFQLPSCSNHTFLNTITYSMNIFLILLVLQHSSTNASLPVVVFGVSDIQLDLW